MHPIDPTQDVVSIATFKTHASALLRNMRGTDRPLVITQSGKPRAVVMNPEGFEELTAAARVVGKILSGLESAQHKTWTVEEVRTAAQAKVRAARNAR